MVETWLHVQPFHGEGVVSAILVDNSIGKRNKKSKTFDFFWFCRFGYQWGRKKGIPKEARRIIAERKHRRLEKKENWKTQKKQGNDKVCAFHFYFILWTWCVLGLHNVNAPILFFFFFFFIASAWPVRPSYCIFCVERILVSKNNNRDKKHF